MCPLVCMLYIVFWYGWLNGTHEAKVPCMAKYDLYITYPRGRQALRWEIGLRGKGLRLWRGMLLPLLGLWGYIFLTGRGLWPLPPGIGKTLVWKPKSSNDTPSFISEIIQLMFPLYSFGNTHQSGKKVSCIISPTPQKKHRFLSLTSDIHHWNLWNLSYFDEFPWGVSFNTHQV